MSKASISHMKQSIVALKADTSNIFGARTIFLLRHAPTALNRLQIVLSRTNAVLDQPGRRNSLRVAAILARAGIDQLYSSDLLRAKQTAELIATALQTSPTYDKRLREADHGIFEKMSRRSISFEQFKRTPCLDVTRKRPLGGESLDDVVKRVDSFIQDRLARSPGSRVLIVAHNATIRAAALLACEVHRSVASKLAIPHLSLSVVDTIGQKSVWGVTSRTAMQALVKTNL
jgi:broad specificity phosphatase PhoE